MHNNKQKTTAKHNNQNKSCNRTQKQLKHQDSRLKKGTFKIIKHKRKKCIYLTLTFSPPLARPGFFHRHTPETHVSCSAHTHARAHACTHTYTH